MRKPSRLHTVPIAICALVALFVALPASAVDAATSAVPPQPYLSTIGRPALLPPLRNVTVAVVDTGVDGDHPDLAGRIVASRRVPTMAQPAVLMAADLPIDTRKQNVHKTRVNAGGDGASGPHPEREPA